MADKNSATLPENIKRYRVGRRRPSVTSEKLAEAIFSILRHLNKETALKILDLLIYKLQFRRDELK
jgi:hypothetical protein